MFGSFFNIPQVLLQYLGFCSGHLEGSISPVIKAPPLSHVSPVLQQIVPSSVVVQDGAATSAVLQRAGLCSLQEEPQNQKQQFYGFHPAHPLEGKSFWGVEEGAWH